jgi:hypothetical protein
MIHGAADHVGVEAAGVGPVGGVGDHDVNSLGSQDLGDPFGNPLRPAVTTCIDDLHLRH